MANYQNPMNMIVVSVRPLNQQFMENQMDIEPLVTTYIDHVKDVFSQEYFVVLVLRQKSKSND